MPLTPFFLHGSPSEQRLIQDLVNEHLRNFGQDILYLPRRIVNEQTVIKEITASRFDDSFRIEAYLSNFDGFGTPSDVLTKFGVRATDEVTLVISKERYDDFISPKLKLWPKEEIKVATTPQEGDLIFLPLDDALFEIKYVERKVPFYQLNDLYMYELRCEIFEYEDERIDLPSNLTDVNGEEIKDGIAAGGQQVTIQFHKDTVDNALATIGYASTIFGTKSVQYIQMFDDGNYKGTPSVRVAKPKRGERATGIVTSLVNGTVEKVDITFGGNNYIQIPTIQFTPPNKPASSQIKFGNNGLEHTSYNDVTNANIKATSDINARVTEDGRLVFSLWFWPNQFDPDPNFGGVIAWTDKFKLYHRETGNVVFSSGSGSIENTSTLNLNAWNFIRVEVLNQEAKVCVNGNVSNTLGTADPTMVFTNDDIKLGSDAGGQGKSPTITRGFIGNLDHITLNQTGDNTFSSVSETLVPTTEAEQELDTQSGTVSSFVNNLDNEYPIVTVGLNTSREVYTVTIEHPGNGYASIPLLTIDEPELGEQATAVAIMTSRTGIPNQAIDRILLTNPGFGYTEPPIITLSGGTPVSTGIATAIISERVLGPVAITTGGRGYTFTPTVGITSTFIPSSVGISSNIRNAKAEAVVGTGQTVVSIRYSNAGAGYTFTPTIDIGEVEAIVYGDFVLNELVRGVSTGTSAYVTSWDSLNRILEVSLPNGEFAVNEAIVGAGASYRVANVETTVSNIPFASNDEIELEADLIVDFSERNPFGEV
jgi:hypothetical protein